MMAAKPEAAADRAAAPAPARSAISDEEVSALLESGAENSVQAFDLTSRRVSRTELPMLELACRNFVERAQASLSTMANRDAVMRFEGLQRLKVSDLQASLPSPAGIAVVRIKPLEGQAFINVEPNLLLSMLDGFFGGAGRAAADPQAVASPAAQRFLGLAIRTIGVDFSAAWAAAAPVELEFVKSEINPRLLQIGDAEDMAIVAKFSVEFGAHTGYFNWLLPEVLLRPIREALAADGGKKSPRPQPAWAPALGASLQRAELEARAVLVEARISLGELVRLTPGDIIPIEPPQQVVLLAGNVPLYRGRFGVSQGHNAVKITSRGPAR